MSNKRKINWLITSFLVATPIVGIGGTALLLMFGHIAWQTWVLALILTFASGLGITAGYHRLFSHRTYEASWLPRLLFVLFGSANFEGSVFEWCTDHRNHHRHTDTDQDPYSINKGFWSAHIGWLFTLDASRRKFDNIDDLKLDPILRWQDKYFVLIAIFMGFLFPTLIASLWGNALGGFIVAGTLRIVVSQHGTFCVNSVCHWFGKKTYSLRESARDNWVTAIITFGEGYHNFHHKFPLDYRNGIRFYHFDPTKWLINFLSWCGLASNRKMISDKRILQCRLQAEEQRILEEASVKSDKNWSSSIQQAVQPMLKGIENLLQHIEKLEGEYNALKKAKMNTVREKMGEYRESVERCRQQLKDARLDLKASLRSWSQLLRKATQDGLAV